MLSYLRIAFRESDQHAHPSHAAALLGARAKRPSGHRSAEKCNERAPSKLEHQFVQCQRPRSGGNPRSAPQKAYAATSIAYRGMAGLVLGPDRDGSAGAWRPISQFLGMSGTGTTQTSRSRPDTSVHWGEAVEVTPRSK